MTPTQGTGHSGVPDWYQRLLDAGIEENGIKPVPVGQRTSTQYSNLFTVFFTCLLCLLPVPTGMLATLEFGMSLRDSSLVILFFALLTCIPPAFMGIGGMETGLRQLVQARYSFGRYLITVPLLLNAATVTGFSLVSAVVGGQTIASLNPDNVSVNIGIIITCLVSFAVSLLGFKAVHFWERWTWIPNLIALVIAVGFGGKYLHLQSEVPPSTPQQVLSYGGLIAGYFITFGGTVSDYSIYHNPRGVSKLKIFLYIYLGLLLPSVPLLVLGAAIGGAVTNVPSWNAAYSVTGIGGVMFEMLAPAGGFGKFVLVLLALSVIGNIAISMYSVSLNLQMLVPFFAKVHRFIFILVTMAFMIPFAIRAAQEWESSMINFLAVIGYWAGCFDAVLIIELVVFRRMDYATYDHAIWNVGGKLPPGIAALGASLGSLALVVPGMAETWYTGPIAERTGDIGFEMAFVVTGLLYLPFRWLEIKLRGHL
ncbi:permease for cytosine/purines, uracil, thiamine, allantoin-domain-containing protein [Bombardia bombarda]|uniref:Permease for cytosine/purines, uracil, thiamine, allantoin-domain-containing protein n=1 Tax=Bombardia bombarda TaxID=252184 RepID=A0AA39XMV1_9PEZI|nr:permease for cytosine/purines, uracil, thiamine, allantoin-domain-containing protein [Bombardia bombarda]